MKNILIVGIITIGVLVGGVSWSKSLAEKSIEDSASSDNSVISSTGIHWHPGLEIYIRDEKQDIPANLGLVGAHNPIHTHDPDGIVHLEYGTAVVRNDDTRLGNFFDVWGKEFNSGQILDSVNGEGGNVKMLVNGEENFDFENYLMKDGDKIEIRFE